MQQREAGAEAGTDPSVEGEKGQLELVKPLGVGDIIEKNYRQPIYRNFSNYRQIIDIEYWQCGNFRKIIDIANCIQFCPTNTIESVVLKQGGGVSQILRKSAKIMPTKFHNKSVNS